MARLTLKRVLRRRGAGDLLGQIGQGLGVPWGITDPSGELLAGTVPDAPDAAIEHEGQVLGHAHGSAAGVLASYLNYCVSQEQVLQGLATETLARYKELTLLHDIGLLLSRWIDVGEVGAAALDEACRFSGADGGVVLLVSSVESPMLEVVAGQSAAVGPGDQVPAQGLVATTLSTDESQLLDAVQPQGALARQKHQGAVMCSPLRCGDRTLGVLYLWHERSGAWTAGDVRMVGSLAAYAAAALQTAVLHRDRLAERRKAEQALQERNRDLAMARDEALRANAAKSAFLANMSHELRTPLNAIIGYSEIVVDELDVDWAVEDVSRIRSAALHLLELIEGLLCLSKIEAGRMEMSTSWVDVPKVVGVVIETLTPTAVSNRNRLLVEVGADVQLLYCDSTWLRQVLQNLLSNACKFTEKGTVKLTVQQDADVCRFVVSDTGIGMSSEQVGRVFDDFTQADSSTTRRFGGTGLGLAISRRLTSLMGGSIRLESKLGGGTIATVELPVAAPTESTACPTPS